MRMKLFFFSNKFPNDDLPDLLRRLRLHSQSPEHVVLRRVLEETTRVVREEIRRLPPELRSLIPPFQSILDLAENYNWHKGSLSGAFESVFLCLVPLCLFVGNYESRPHEYGFDAQRSLLTGLGLGFLAATAIVASPSLLDLPTTAAEVVRIAMRAGILLYQKSQDLEPQRLDGPPESWTTVVRGLDEKTVQEELEMFNTSMESPPSSKVYISVVEPDGSVFVSGPPSRLRMFFNKPGKVQSAPRAPLPVYGGPCHAAHLYDRTHSAWVVSEVHPGIASRRLSGAPLMLSMGDGQPLAGETVGDLFESATYVLLTSIIRWSSVLAAATKFPHWRHDMKLQLEAFRPSSPVVHDLLSAVHTGYPECDVSVKDLGQWILDDSLIPPSSAVDSKIAVVGMSCRLPGGSDDLQRFWELLEDGRDVHQKVPADRYDVESHTDITGKRPNTSHTPFGCFIDSPGLFDAGFFDMSPREAGQTDPTHRLALLTAYEALEQSGYVPDRTRSTTRDRVGTTYGQCSDDYREANAGQSIDMYFIPGNYRAFAPGRISYFFKFSGPSFNCDTACSASLSAIQIACTVLSRGEADMVVAGGLNVLTGSDSFAGLSQGFFLSKTGNCKVFDDSADGYCRGDGIGSIVLKRLSDAQQDNDNILGVILGTATNHSSQAVSITHPHAPTQEQLYRSVLTQAGIRPDDVDLVEMHGTGTQAGDAAEIESVTRVFSPSVPRRLHPLYISSVKANVGHGEAAAGITALIKALLILQHNAIPRHVGIKTVLNSRFPDLERLNVRIPMETIPWPYRSDRKRLIMVNNFSAAGGNTSLLLEEPPVRPDPHGPPQTRFVVAVSAKSTISLRRNLERLITWLEGNPSTQLASLAYTTTARRIHHKYHIAVHGASITEIVQGLHRRLPNVETRRLVNKPPSVAFVFSGQGSFYMGVSGQLFQEYPPYREQIQRLDEICQQNGFGSILPAITDAGVDVSQLSALVTQLATVCVQIALCRFWRTLGVKPAVVVGASLGEYAALYAAGALSASDVIFLVGQRALLMQTLCTANSHGMLAVQATVDDIRRCVQGRAYEVACINGPQSITITASIKDIMEPILDRYEEIAKSVPFRSLKIPFISPTLGDVALEGRTLVASSYLRDNTRAPVRFAEALAKAQDMGLAGSHTAWVEIGVHPTYSGAVRATVADLEVIVPSLRSDETNWHTLAISMCTLQEAGVPLEWNEWYRPFESEVGLLNLPPYQWDLKNHWIQHNGDWLLVKDKRPATDSVSTAPPSLRTALVHQILEESFWADGGEIMVQSDVMNKDFFAVASGHKMSGRPLVSVFAYTDIAFSLARYMYSRLKPESPLPAMDFGQVRVFQGLIPRKDQSQPQWVRMRMQADLQRMAMQLSLYHLLDDTSQTPEEKLASGFVTCGDRESWQDEWAGYAYLVTTRIATLHQMADHGQASRVSRDLVYTLFKNIVDYSELYRGIQSAVLHGLEAVADVILAPSHDGRWTAPPHHIDPITHVAGLVLNAGHATDHHNTIYVMDGWKSMRFAEELVPGELYRSYVKMNPARNCSGFFFGDVYVLRGDRVIGNVREMTLRPLPRILMNRFFDPPDGDDGRLPHQVQPRDLPQLRLQPSATTESSSGSDRKASGIGSPTPEVDLPITACERKANTQLVRDALALLAAETGMEPDCLTDETELSALGIDSLLSLVLKEKFATELQVDIQSSFFLESPTIRELKEYLTASY
ncbi:conidial yellow pigment biosynthesis polyketide synthase [Aspergillus udagawae]|nr:conidial yellow pigment biosynthesis polyketide synthase [Aspergillus udagawae]